MRVSIIVAAAENGVIGAGNRLPWHLPDDLKHFKALTLGKPMIMGRRTFESIGRPLPGRTSFVVSRQPGLQIAGCTVTDTIDAALEAAREQGAPEVMIVGGAEIYRQVLPRTSVIHLTRVHAHIDGDVRFPELPAGAWREVDSERHPADDRHVHAFSFIKLARIPR
jgi:dihydrofolate reductase